MKIGSLVSVSFEFEDPFRGNFYRHYDCELLEINGNTAKVKPWPFHDCTPCTVVEVRLSSIKGYNIEPANNIQVTFTATTEDRVMSSSNPGTADDCKENSE